MGSNWRGSSAMLLFVVFVVVQSACTSPSRPDISARDMLRAAQQMQEVARDRQRVDSRYVAIYGDDVVLPTIDGGLEPTTAVTYDFYVWADDPLPNGGHRRSIKELMDQRLLEVDVIGAQATIQAVGYAPSDDAKAVVNDSYRTVRITVSSKDVKGNFRIIAWFKDAYQAEERNRAQNPAQDQGASRGRPGPTSVNPYGAVRNIRVLSGDLRTQVYILSDDEARHAFGQSFANHFFIGRAYFFNRHMEKELVVNTTSLRARCLFFRPGNPDLYKEIFEKDGTRKGDWMAASSRAYESDLGASLFTKSGLTSEQVSRIVRLSMARFWGLAQWPGTSDDYKNGDYKGGDYIGKGEDISEFLAPVPNSSKFADAVLRKPTGPAGLGVLDFQTEKDLSPAMKAEALDIVRKSYEAVYPTAKQLLVRLSADVEAARANKRQALDQNVLNAVVTRLMSKWPAAFGFDSEKDDDWNADTLDPLDFKRVDTAISDAVAALGRVGEELSKAVTASQLGIQVSPLTMPNDVTASPGRKRIALSDDPARQAELAATGYMWEDHYRPMTFAAILVSLLALAESEPERTALNVLQSIGTVVAALVGLGSISKLFTTDVWAQSALLSTGVILPEARKLFLDDIDNALKNLQTLSLDTVIKIPPKGSRDGYVFFPKGPILYNVDEFTFDQPSFIANIDNDDVAVDGLLVHEGSPISSGYLDAATLVGNARTQGLQLEEQERQKLGTLLDRVKRFQLASLENAVKDRIRSGDRASAEALVAQFEAEYGDSSKPLVAHLRGELGTSSDAPLVFLESINPAKHVINNELTVQMANQKTSFEYHFRLPREATSTAVTVRVVDGPEDVQIAWTAPKTGESGPTPVEGKAGEAVMVQVAKDSWHAPHKVTITLNGAPTKEVVLTIRHSVISSEASLDGKQAELVVRVKVSQ